MRYGDYFHVAVHDCACVARHRRQPRDRRRDRSRVAGDGAPPERQRAAGRPRRGGAPVRAPARRARHATEQGFLLWALFDVIVDRYFEVTDAIDERLDDDRGGGLQRRRADGHPRDVFARAPRPHDAPARRGADARGRERHHPQGDRLRRRRGDRALPRHLRPRAARRSTSSSRSATCSPACSRPTSRSSSNQLNQVMKKMTSWGAILIVATLIAGIYGMNFRHMPELDWEFGYPLALGLMVLATVRALPAGSSGRGGSSQLLLVGGVGRRRPRRSCGGCRSRG